jgi:hypothetical protein
MMQAPCILYRSKMDEREVKGRPLRDGGDVHRRRSRRVLPQGESKRQSWEGYAKAHNPKYSYSRASRRKLPVRGFSIFYQHLHDSLSHLLWRKEIRNARMNFIGVNLSAIPHAIKAGKTVAQVWGYREARMDCEASLLGNFEVGHEQTSVCPSSVSTVLHGTNRTRTATFQP